MKNHKLVSLRKEKELSMSDMAREIGVSTSYYEKIEYGNRMPSYNFLTKFKSAFPEMNLEDVFLSQNHT